MIQVQKNGGGLDFVYQHESTGPLVTGRFELSSTNFIWNFVVDEFERGRGHGKRMMGEGLEKIKEMGIKEVGLTVWAYNEPALKIYRHYGFVQVDSRGGGEVLIMKKEL